LCTGDVHLDRGRLDLCELRCRDLRSFIGGHRVCRLRRGQVRSLVGRRDDVGVCELLGGNVLRGRLFRLHGVPRRQLLGKRRRCGADGVRAGGVHDVRGGQVRVGGRKRLRVVPGGRLPEPGPGGVRGLPSGAVFGFNWRDLVFGVRPVRCRAVRGNPGINCLRKLRRRHVRVVGRLDGVHKL